MNTDTRHPETTKMPGAGGPVAWHGDIPVTSLYTAGIAGERFFRALQREGKLLATRCGRCRVTYLLPRLFCERCLDRLEEWVEVPPEGTIHTFTIVRIDLDGGALDPPRAVGLVAFKGVAGGVVHYLEGDPDKLKVGQKVRMVLKPPRERRGHILDIDHFIPV
jgi:uncharacterized OB-fold protein